MQRRGAEPLHYAADANRWEPTAQAETICSKCPFIGPAASGFGTYLGAHWPRDRSTFLHEYTLEGLGSSDEYWVFDLNDNATVSLTVSTLR